MDITLVTSPYFMNKFQNFTHLYNFATFQARNLVHLSKIFWSIWRQRRQCSRASGCGWVCGVIVSSALFGPSMSRCLLLKLFYDYYVRVVSLQE